MVVFGQKWFCWGKVMYSVKVVVVFGQKRLYLGKCGCLRARRLYSGKVVVFG